MSRPKVKYFSSVHEALNFMHREGRDWVYPHQRLFHEQRSTGVVLVIRSKVSGQVSGYVMEEA